jgi:hypothetical protein
MPTQTTTYDLDKPLVNSAVDQDLWGGQLNADLDIIDNELGSTFISVASATPNIGAAASRNVLLTGTTTITAFDTVNAGITRRVRFDDALTLTHNGTSLILPGAANITTAADDTMVVVSLGSGNWIVTSYQPASDTPGLLDEDDMSSDSAKQAPTQQSVKAYVDTEVSDSKTSFWSYSTDSQTISSGGGLTLAHSLGAKPQLIRTFIVCISAEDGWSVGDEIEVYSNSQAPNSRGLTVYSDATNIYVRFGNDGTVWSNITKSTGATASLDVTKWTLSVRAI